MGTSARVTLVCYSPIIYWGQVGELEYDWCVLSI